jgi:hypothetical protein
MSPIPPGGIVRARCTESLRANHDDLPAAIEVATRSPLALSSSAVGLVTPRFQIRPFAPLEPLSFNRWPDAADEMRRANAAVWHTNCWDRATCWHDVVDRGVPFWALGIAAFAAMLYWLLRAATSKLGARWPFVFGMVALVYGSALVICLWAESNPGLGMAGILFVMPALVLGLPWNVIEFPLVGLRADFGATELRAFMGLLLNATILSALALWRPGHRADVPEKRPPKRWRLPPPRYD